MIMTKTKKGNKDHADRADSGETAAIQSNSTAGLTEVLTPEADSQPCQDHPTDGFDMAIRELAYLKWEAAGFPAGDGIDFWLEAERELKANREATDTAPE
jgi:hypothetical protein